MKNLERHQRKCKICKSPQRAEIEKMFSEGTSLRYIRYKYPIASIMSFSTHFKAFGIKPTKAEKPKKCLSSTIPELDLNKPYMYIVSEEASFYIQEGRVYAINKRFICFEDEFDKENLRLL